MRTNPVQSDESVWEPCLPAWDCPTQELIELARPVFHWFIQHIDFHQLVHRNVKIRDIYAILFGLWQWCWMASAGVLDLNSWPSWCNAWQCISIERWRSPHKPKIAPVLPIFPRGPKLFWLFAFARLVSRNHQSDHLGLLQGMHLNGIAWRQSLDLRSHSAVFPIANGFHRSSSIPEWCNWRKLTNPPIFWYQNPLLFQGHVTKTFTQIS